MSLLFIIDYYVRNSLTLGGVDYSDKLNHLLFFADKPNAIDSIIDYCNYRLLSGVANATINRELTIVRAAINYYNKHHDDVIKNPFNGFRLFEKDYLPRYLTPHECTKLLNVCKGYSNPKFYHFVNLLLNTGCRTGELIKLEWQTVNIDQRYMTIRNSLSKNRKTIHKPLNNSAISSLQALQTSSNWVFVNEKTGKHYANFKKAWRLSIEKANIGHVRLHDLRHTFASLLVQNGTPIYHVMQLLGHSDIKTTQKYAHLSPSNLLYVVQSLPIQGY